MPCYQDTGMGCPVALLGGFTSKVGKSGELEKNTDPPKMCPHPQRGHEGPHFWIFSISLQVKLL